MNIEHKNPVVSVVMAVYNGRPYLKEAVDSILSQTFKNFEFIIINDGSTDGSGDLLDALQSNDNRIRVFSTQNAGLTKSLNFGLSKASGSYVARMDADDRSHPDRFQKQIDFLENHPEVVALGSWVNFIDSKGRIQFQRRLPRTHLEIERCHLTDWGGFIMHPSMMCRFAAMKEVEFYDEKFTKAQDYDLWFRLAQIGKLANLNEFLLDYRYHDRNISRNSRAEQTSCRQIILGRELEKKGLNRPYDLEAAFQIYPQNTKWLLQTAIEQELLTAALRAFTRLSFQSPVGIYQAARIVFKALRKRRRIQRSLTA